MAQQLRKIEAQDADAVYILGKISHAEQLDAESKEAEQSSIDKKRMALDERIAAGQRLIEVREKAKLRDNEMSRNFIKWLEQNGIAERTAYDLMALAGATPEEREEKKAKDAERKREERKASYSVEVVLNSIYPSHANYSSTTKRELKEELCRVNPDILKRENEELLRSEALKIFTMRHPDHFAPQREQLPEKMEKKVERAIAIERAQLHKEFDGAVEGRVSSILADRIAHLDNLTEKADQMARRYQAMSQGIKPYITETDYKFLLNILHPDRAPEDRKEKFAKAFDIVRKLDKYIEASK